MKPITRQTLFTQLDALGIAHTTQDHPPIFTVEEGAQIKAALPGGHTKNLFLKDKAGVLFLICALGETPIRLNKLHPHLSSKRLSFGSADLLLKHLGVTPGSVTLFSILNDVSNQVQLVLDQALFDDPLVNFHPLENTATTTFASTDIIPFAKACDHTPLIIDFKGLQDAIAEPT